MIRRASRRGRRKSQKIRHGHRRRPHVSRRHLLPGNKWRRATAAGYVVASCEYEGAGAGALYAKHSLHSIPFMNGTTLIFPLHYRIYHTCTVLAKRVCHGLREFQQSLRNIKEIEDSGGAEGRRYQDYIYSIVDYHRSFFNIPLQLTWTSCQHVSCKPVQMLELRRCTHVVSWNKERGELLRLRRRIGSMMTWTLKRPSSPLHYAIHAVVLWLRGTKRRAGKPVRQFLWPARPPPPHLVFICVTSRAACLPL